MSKRISSYPNKFAKWNLINNIDSIVSVVTVWLFLNIVYKQLWEGKSITRYSWATPQFYTDILQAVLNKNYPNLEWVLINPSKPQSLPL